MVFEMPAICGKNVPATGSEQIVHARERLCRAIEQSLKPKDLWRAVVAASVVQCARVRDHRGGERVYPALGLQLAHLPSALGAVGGSRIDVRGEHGVAVVGDGAFDGGLVEGSPPGAHRRAEGEELDHGEPFLLERLRGTAEVAWVVADL